MNRNLLLAGMLFGALFSFSLIGGLQLSGLAVAGQDEITLDLTLNQSGAVALTTPQQLTFLALDATYTGSGRVHIDLVGPNATWRVADYETPQRLGNASFLLEKGGTVVRLEKNLTYQHRFSAACEETCQANLTGPFLLQVTLENGNLALDSLAYDSPSIITSPVTPENTTIPPAPESEPEPLIPPHENPAPECTLDSECGPANACHVGYCISRTGHLNITDNQGRLVALFDKHGRVLLKEGIHQATSEEPPRNAFRIETPVGVAAWVTDTGALYLRGYLHEHALEIPLIGSQNFLVRNPEGDVLVVHGHSGDLFTRDAVVEGILP